MMAIFSLPFLLGYLMIAAPLVLIFEWAPHFFPMVVAFLITSLAFNVGKCRAYIRRKGGW